MDYAQNFTLTLKERVAAYGGPPAYMRRRRAIEELEARIIDRLATLLARGLRLEDVHRRAPHAELAELNRLIGHHNAYYPVEANLPMQPGTGVLMDRGEPWRPMCAVSLNDCLLRARQSRSRAP